MSRSYRHDAIVRIRLSFTDAVRGLLKVDPK
jgi:hypothetical protein